MEQKSNFSLTLAMLATTFLLGIVASGHLFQPSVKVHAEGSRFDHIQIVSTTFIHKGQLGLLLLDRRNANVWFLPMSTDESRRDPLGDPVFLIKVRFEKLDPAPSGAP
jgi:hypothetical protein